VVVKSRGQLATEGESVQGALAQHVDRPARFAGPLIQALRAAQHFDAIVHLEVKYGGHGFTTAAQPNACCASCYRVLGPLEWASGGASFAKTFEPFMQIIFCSSWRSLRSAAQQS